MRITLAHAPSSAPRGQVVCSSPSHAPLEVAGIPSSGAGWGLSPAGHPVDLIVGGIAEKPAVVGGRVEPREILHLTVAFDHDVMDGGPAARFVGKLIELMECGAGLEEVAAVRAA